MAMQIETAQTLLDGSLHVQVWLDTTKTQADGTTPDPAYLRSYTWGKDVPQAQAKAETKALCQAELAKMAGPSTVGTLQGTAL